MMTEVAVMSSQRATKTQKRTGPDVQCRATFTGSRATGRFEKDARMDLELIVCEFPPYRCCSSVATMFGYYYCRIPDSSERFDGR
jgi:hypothetical protein